MIILGDEPEFDAILQVGPAARPRQPLVFEDVLQVVDDAAVCSAHVPADAPRVERTPVGGWHRLAPVAVFDLHHRPSPVARFGRLEGEHPALLLSICEQHPFSSVGSSAVV